MCSTINIIRCSIHTMFIYLDEFEHTMIFLSAFGIQVLLNVQYAIFYLALGLCPDTGCRFSTAVFNTLGLVATR